MNVALLFNNFLGGETSPLIAARVDSAAYAAGAKILKNFIPIPTGGVRKRPGTWLRTAGAATGNARLIEWETGLEGDNARLLLVLSAAPASAVNIAIYKKDQTAGPTLLTLTGVGEAQLFEIQYATTREANVSTMWLVHRNMKPQCIKVLPYLTPYMDEPAFFDKHETGTFTTVELTWYTDFTLMPNWIEDGQGRDIGANSAFTLMKDLPLGPATTPPLEVVSVRCHFWITQDSSEETGVIVGSNIVTFTDPAQFVKLSQFIVPVTITAPLPGAIWTSFGGTMEYQTKDPGVSVTIFNAAGKYPGTVAVYAGRLCFGGTNEYPSRIWLSRPPDSITGKNRFTDFSTGENAGDAIVIEENDMSGSRLLWLAAGRRLIAGTARSTWSDNGAVPTPASFDMGIVEYAGANAIMPQGTKEIMAYAGRNGKTLRAVVWQETQEGSGFIDADISRNAPHLFTSGIADFDVMDYPYPVIWVVTGDGGLVSCTVDVRSGILAMARHDTIGEVKSCVVRREDGKDDTLFLAVARPDNGPTDIVTLTLPEVIDADYEESHFLDCGIRIQSGTSFTQVTLPVPLQRDDVVAFADGWIEPATLSADKSTLTFQNPVSLAHIGLPYTSVLSPNTPEIPANGTSIGKKRRIEKATLKVYQSIGGKCGPTEEKAAVLQYMKFGQYELGTAPQPFTGNIDISVGGTIDPEGRMVITHGEPVPFTLLALIERVAILEA